MAARIGRARGIRCRRACTAQRGVLVIGLQGGCTEVVLVLWQRPRITCGMLALGRRTITRHPLYGTCWTELA